VVRSTYGEEKDSLENIDNLFGAPNKITIPERYNPSQVSLLIIEKFFNAYLTTLV
jgi:hypothetical protein